MDRISCKKGKRAEFASSFARKCEFEIFARIACQWNNIKAFSSRLQ